MIVTKDWLEINFYDGQGFIDSSHQEVFCSWTRLGQYLDKHKNNISVAELYTKGGDKCIGRIELK